MFQYLRPWLTRVINYTAGPNSESMRLDLHPAYVNPAFHSQRAAIQTSLTLGAGTFGSAMCKTAGTAGNDSRPIKIHET